MGVSKSFKSAGKAASGEKALCPVGKGGWRAKD